MNDKIKFAVVGLGHIGTRHIQHIEQHPNAELVTICDVDDSKKKLYNYPFYLSIEDMLKNNDIDIVNICTPNYLHAEHTILSLNNNKHVVCEKPMAISVLECEQMIAAAEQHNKNIFVVKQNRYNPPVQQIKNLINNKNLGKILLINVNCFWNRNDDYYKQSTWRGTKQKDGGALFTQFSHFVDILYYLFGYCKPIHSKMNNFIHPSLDTEDTGICLLETKEGAIVNFNFSTCSYEKNMEGAITIIAEKGTVKIGGQYLNTIEYQHIKDIELENITIEQKNNHYGLYQGSMSNHDKIIDNVVNTLLGKDKNMTNPYEGKDVIQMIEEMYNKNNSI